MGEEAAVKKYCMREEKNSVYIQLYAVYKKYIQRQIC